MVVARVVRMAGVIVLASAALPIACSDGGAPDSDPAVPALSSFEVVERERRLVVDLVEALPFARAGFELERLDFGAEGVQSMLTQGWYAIQKGEGAEPFVWSVGRNSTIDFVIASPGPRTLVLGVEPVDGKDKLPQQSLRLALNGRELGSFLLEPGPQSLRVAVPEGVLRVGLNRFESMPLYWIAPASAGVGVSHNEVAVRYFEFALEGGEGGAGGVGERVAVEREQATLLQAPTSAIAWHQVVPERARWVASGELVGVDATGSMEGEVRFTLVDEDGASRLLQSRSLASLASRPAWRLEADLSAYAGRHVGLAVGFATTGEGSTPLLRHDRSVLEGIALERKVEGGLEGSRPNVLVVLFDTLRADFIGPYGNTEVDTPALDQLAERGVTFENAFANASWTRPSVASLMTGLQPDAHRVVGARSALPAGVPYLPELMKAAGYRTVGITNNAHYSANGDFQRGYDDFHPYYTSRQQVLEKIDSPVRQADLVFDRYLERAFDASARGGPPVFAYVHEIDPHSPYDPPPPYAERYDIGYRGNIDGWNRAQLDQGFKMLRLANDFAQPLEPADHRYMMSRYAGEVSFMDRYFGRLMERLEALGVSDRTLVVFVSDHGEQFHEHGAWGHGLSLYDEELRVPMILSLPGVIPKGGRSGVHAQLSDLPATILDLAGLAVPDAIQGRSLLADAVSPAQAPERVTRARSNFVIWAKGTFFTHKTQWHSIQRGDWKLLRREFRQFGTLRYDHFLFDVRRDPDELMNLWPGEAQIGHALRQRLELELARDHARDFEASESATEALDPADEENLRALGYIE